MTNIPKNIGEGDSFLIKKGGKEMLLRIVSDKSPDDPRNWDNVGTMVCFHKRYNLGDKHNWHDPQDFLLTTALGKDIYEREDERNEAYNTDDETYKDPEDMPFDELLAIIREKYAILPLYLYDHSGITMKTTPFGCRWDSGQVGYIYASKEDVLRNYDATEENWREVGEEGLKHEVSTYDDYITGSVFGYQLHEIKNNEATDDIVESCYGFFGNNTKANGILDDFDVLREVEVTVHKHTTVYFTIA